MGGGSLSASRISVPVLREMRAVLADLTKLGRYGLGVHASQAMESLHVVVWFVTRLNARNIHRQVARRTASLSDWSLGRVKAVWLRHERAFLTSPILSHDTPTEATGRVGGLHCRGAS